MLLQGAQMNVFRDSMPRQLYLVQLHFPLKSIHDLAVQGSTLQLHVTACACVGSTEAFDMLYAGCGAQTSAQNSDRLTCSSLVTFKLKT